MPYADKPCLLGIVDNDRRMLDYNDLGKSYPYGTAFIIVVSKKHIKCITVEELKKGDCIDPDCKHYLGNRKEFDLDKNVIIDFCKFATQFFENV